MAGDKTYITDSGGKQHRATRVYPVTPTDIVWSSNPNDYTVQVKVDGKWHRAVLTMDAGTASFFDNINIDKGLIVGSDGKTHTALIVKPESTVTLSSIKTDEHALVSGTTTGETAVVTYEETWGNVKYQDNVNVYKVLVTGSDGKVHTALLTTSAAGGGTIVVVLGTSPLSLPNAVANSLQYVKAFGGTEQSGTPTPDTPVNIVCNNGPIAFHDTELPTAYRRILGMTMNNDCYYEITGFKMNGSDTLRFSFTRTGSNACNVLGAYDGGSSQRNYSLYAGGSSSASYLRYNGGTYNSYAIADKKYNVVITPTGSDGMETDSTWTAKTFTSNTNLCIGTTSPSATSSKMVGSIHGTIAVDGRLELIPCERVSDGEIGYYDTYTNTFYEPIGTTPTSLGYDDSHYDFIVNGPIETIKDSLNHTATCENLFAIDDNIDVQSILDGVVTRKIGYRVFDGTESFGSSSAYGTALYIGSASASWGADRTKQVLCTHFLGLGPATGQQPLYSCFFNASGHFYFRTTETATNFKTRLRNAYKDGNPMILVFVKGNAATESVAGQTLQVKNGSNTLRITQAGMGGLELEAEYTKNT